MFCILERAGTKSNVADDEDTGEEWDLSLTSIQQALDVLKEQSLGLYIKAQREMNDVVNRAQQPADAQTVHHAVILRCLIDFAQRAEGTLDCSTPDRTQSTSEHASEVDRNALSSGRSKVGLLDFACCVQ